MAPITLHARCDESFLHAVASTPFYVVAGYLGTEEQWQQFNSLWRQSTKALGIAAIGVHASDCERGYGIYRAFSEQRRREFEYRLVVDIAAARLQGYVSAIDMRAYREHQPLFKKFLARPEYQKFNEPHVLAIRQCIHQMALVTATDKAPIAFVADRNGQFGGRAREWFRKDTGDPSLDYRQRLQSFEESDRFTVLGLQAADLLAYSALRNLCGDPGWCWADLNRANEIVEVISDARWWQEIADSIQERQKEVAALTTS